MRSRIPILALVLAPPAILAQTNQGAAPSAEMPQPAAETPAHAWSLSAMIYGYIVPNDSDLALPIVAADRGGLHLEARYNYEALKTGSVWLGYNFPAARSWLGS